MKRDQIDVTEKVKDATLGLGRAVVRRMCFFVFLPTTNNSLVDTRVKENLSCCRKLRRWS